jgi:hypothetical protein
MFGKIDYEGYPLLEADAKKLIEDNLNRIIGNETTQDWIDLVHFYTSKKCPSSREEVEIELEEMLRVT